MKRILFTFGFVSILLITACDFEAAKKAHKQENTMQKPSQVSITLGDSFNGFVERYPSVKKKHQDTKQWGFLNWYQFNWPTKKAGVPAESVNQAKTRLAGYYEKNFS